MAAPGETEGTHGYYDWQVATLMLAYDAVEPVRRDDAPALHRREEAVMHELREIARAVIPPEYHSDEGRELPPEVIVRMTRATLRRAAEVTGLL